MRLFTLEKKWESSCSHLCYTSAVNPPPLYPLVACSSPEHIPTFMLYSTTCYHLELLFCLMSSVRADVIHSLTAYYAVFYVFIDQSAKSWTAFSVIGSIGELLLPL